MSGPLHIPFIEISSYCHLYGIIESQRKIDFADFVKILDNIWIEDYYVKDQKKKQAETNNKKKK